MTIVKIVDFSRGNAVVHALSNFIDELRDNIYGWGALKTYNKLSDAQVYVRTLNSTIYNRPNYEDLILCTNSPLLKGVSNYCNYSICGSDADESVKKFADYISQFPFNSQEFDMEAAYAIYYMYADAVGGNFKLAIKEHLLKVLGIKLGTHLLDHSEITQSFLEKASIGEVFKAIKEL